VIGPQSRFFVVLLGALMMVNVLSIDMTLPALPQMGAILGASPDEIQLTLSLYLVGYALGQIALGPLSDRFGRRPVLLSGLAIYALASLACALSTGIDPLVTARVVQGIAACGGPVIVRAIVRDHWSGTRAAQTLSSLTTVFAAGPLFAPIIGGAILVRFGWAAIFAAIALVTIMLLLAAWFGLAESLASPDREALRPARIAANYAHFFAQRVSVGYGVVNGLCWVGLFAFISSSPFVLIGLYHVAPNHYGYYFGLTAVTLVLGASTNRRLLRVVPSERVLRIGFGCLAIGGAVTLAVPFSPWNGPLALMGGVMIYTFGQTLVQPNAVALALDPLRHMAGTGSALLGVIQMLLGAIGGYAVNAFYDGTAKPMGMMMLGAALAAAATYAALLRRRTFAL
jgi:DHA1 family bicyclomycin/chloramphenicol resistance-like MFS transporter